MKHLSFFRLSILAMFALSASLSAVDHWVLKPCGDGKGTCFQAVSYPVYYYLEPAGMWGWGWGPEWDDGDAIPEAVILLPKVSGDNSWEKIGPKGQFETHYRDPEMPFLWCDARNFSDFYTWGSAMSTWGFNLALLDIANDLTGIWRLDQFKDLRGCWVGKGHYQEHMIMPTPDGWNWEAQIFGRARNSQGKEFDVRMQLKLQVPRGAPIPEGAHIEHIEFRSTPTK